MASVVYNIAKTNWMKGTLDMDAASNIRARLCMVTTTADTEIDEDTWGGLTTDGESDDGSYAAQTLTSLSVVTDDPNDQAEFQSATPISFTLAGDAASDYQGMLLVDYVDGGDGDIPIAFIEFNGQPIAKEVTKIDVTMPSAGWIKIS